MPNLSIKYGESITAVYSDNFSEKEKHNLKKIFLFLVPLIWLNREEEIDFYTAFFWWRTSIYLLFFQLSSKNIIQKKK